MTAPDPQHQHVPHVKATSLWLTEQQPMCLGPLAAAYFASALPHRLLAVTYSLYGDLKSTVHLLVA